MPARLAGRQCAEGAAPRAAGTVERCGAARLEQRLTRQRFDSGQKGGEGTGPNPTDRSKPGTKRHLEANAKETLPGAALSPANRHDSMMLAATLDAIPPLRQRRERPRRRPCRFHTDKACDHRRCQAECGQCAIKPRIARPKIETSHRLGRHRWMAERTVAWLNRFRRLTIRYERRLDIHMTFTVLGSALVCLNQINRFC